MLVYVLGRSTVAYSAADGSYLLDYLPAGSYTVQFKAPTAPGATSASGVVVSSGQTTAYGPALVADVTSDASNCGPCGTACSTNHMVPARYNGNCGGTCDPGFTNCDANFRTNGCETNVNTNPMHCGGCGRQCAAGQSCVGGSCV